MAYADCIDELKQAYAEWHWTHQKAKIVVMDHPQQTIVRFRKSSFELYVFSSQRNTHNSTLGKTQPWLKQKTVSDTENFLYTELDHV
jgi:hypothetical protein